MTATAGPTVVICTYSTNAALPRRYNPFAPLDTYFLIDLLHFGHTLDTSHASLRRALIPSVCKAQ